MYHDCAHGRRSALGALPESLQVQDFSVEIGQRSARSLLFRTSSRCFSSTILQAMNIQPGHAELLQAKSFVRHTLESTCLPELPASGRWATLSVHANSTRGCSMRINHLQQKKRWNPDRVAKAATLASQMVAVSGHQALRFSI